MKYLFNFFILCLFFSLIFAICTNAQERKWKGKREIKDGVVYIHNPEKGLWQGKKEMTMQEVLSIGIEDGDENYIKEYK